MRVHRRTNGRYASQRIASASGGREEGEGGVKIPLDSNLYGNQSRDLREGRPFFTCDVLYVPLHLFLFFATFLVLWLHAEFRFITRWNHKGKSFPWNGRRRDFNVHHYDIKATVILAKCI